MNKRQLLLIILISLLTCNTYSQLKFNPITLNDKNQFLFNSIEQVGGNDTKKTLFYGFLIKSKPYFEAISFYPEKFIYLNNYQKLYVQNRMGVYCYDMKTREIDELNIFPGFTKKDEYTISNILETAVSYDNRYLIGKIPVSPTKSKIILYDLLKEKSYNIIKNAEILPGKTVGKWSPDSNYFIYQKNNKTYYFSVNDYLENKQLSEEWRVIGNVRLNNTYWAADNHLIWIEKNIIYKGDPNQFYYRSIYKNYLRQGKIIGKIPFEFDSSFDRFIYNDSSKKFIIVKEGSSIFYYSLTNNITYNPYIQLNDNMRFDKCDLFSSGEGIASVNILLNGKINKQIFLLKKENNNYIYKKFDPEELIDSKIYGYSINSQSTEFIINSSNGAFCYNFASQKLKWKYNDEKVVESINIGYNKWILGGNYTTILYNPENITPLFASSLEDAGFLNENIIVVLNKKKYIIDKKSRLLTPITINSEELYKNSKNNYYRLLSREIKKGFYKESVFLKELYTGKQAEVTGEPILRYKLYQPEIALDYKYYDNPGPEKYEIALVFDCIKTAEGIFPVIQTLDQFKIRSTFFINGNFISINPIITKELSYFNFEICNMFQFYVNLTKTHFLIDKNFIRQGLSSNEENYYNITKKNFSPYWHAPMYSANIPIMKYGNESGYKYYSYNLDSFDWVNKNNKELHYSYYMNNDKMIIRILNMLKPGQSIVFNTGKNYVVRDDWLFNDMDILITELVRSGYSFTVISDLMKKYRE